MRILHPFHAGVVLAALLAPIASPAQAPRAGDLVLTDSIGDRVLVVRGDTGAVQEVSPQATTNLLSLPTGIAVAPDGTIYVSDFGLDRLLRIDPVTGAQAILRTPPFPIGTGNPVEVTDPRALDHTQDILGRNHLYVLGASRLWEASETLFGGWGASAGNTAGVLGDPYDLTIDEADSAVYVAAGRNGLVAQLPPDPCCMPIVSPELLSVGGQPALHHTTGVDRLGSALVASQMIVRESDLFCPVSSGLSRVISIDGAVEVESAGGLLRCPRYVTASRNGSRLYVVDFATTNGNDPRIVQLTRTGSGWSQSILAPDLGTTQVGGMALVVPEAGASASIAAALLALAVLRRRRRSSRAAGSWRALRERLSGRPLRASPAHGEPREARRDEDRAAGLGNDDQIDPVLGVPGDEIGLVHAQRSLLDGVGPRVQRERAGEERNRDGVRAVRTAGRRDEHRAQAGNHVDVLVGERPLAPVAQPEREAGDGFGQRPAAASERRDREDVGDRHELEAGRDRDREAVDCVAGERGPADHRVRAERERQHRVGRVDRQVVLVADLLVDDGSEPVRRRRQQHRESDGDRVPLHEAPPAGFAGVRRVHLGHPSVSEVGRADRRVAENPIDPARSPGECAGAIPLPPDRMTLAPQLGVECGPMKKPTECDLLDGMLAATRAALAPALFLCLLWLGAASPATAQLQLLCFVGTFSPTGTAPCTACPVGTFASGRGSKQCQPCPPGTYADQTGSAACVRDEAEWPENPPFPLQTPCSDADDLEKCIKGGIRTGGIVHVVDEVVPEQFVAIAGKSFTLRPLAGVTPRFEGDSYLRVEGGDDDVRVEIEGLNFDLGTISASQEGSGRFEIAIRDNTIQNLSGAVISVGFLSGVALGPTQFEITGNTVVTGVNTPSGGKTGIAVSVPAHSDNSGSIQRNAIAWKSASQHGSAILVGASGAGLDLDVSGNEIFGEGFDHGIYVIGSNGADLAARVANNTIAGQTDGDDGGAAITGLMRASAGEFTIVNNTIAFNETALQLERDNDPLAELHANVFNNVIAFNESGMVLGGAGFANGFNLVFGNGFDSFSPGQGTRRLDPLLVSSQDLSPTERSPVRNAGSNAHVPADLTIDFAGGPRIVGPRVDIGAYELPEPSGAWMTAGAASALCGLWSARARRRRAA